MTCVGSSSGVVPALVRRSVITQRRRAPTTPSRAGSRPCGADRPQKRRRSAGGKPLTSWARACSTNEHHPVLPRRVAAHRHVDANATRTRVSCRTRRAGYWAGAKHIHSCGHRFGLQPLLPHSHHPARFPSRPPEKFSGSPRGEEPIRRLPTQGKGNTSAALKEAARGRES